MTENAIVEIEAGELADRLLSHSPLTETLMEQIAAEVPDKNVNRVIATYDETVAEYLNPDNWTTLSFTYYGDPKSQPRAKINRVLNRLYDPGATLKQFVVEQVLRVLPNGFKLLDKEIMLTASYYRQIPKNTPPAKQLLMEAGVIRPIIKPDVDNYDKLLMDALTKVLYGDDCIIISSYTDKFYSAKPRVEFKLMYKK